MIGNETVARMFDLQKFYCNQLGFNLFEKKSYFKQKVSFEESIVKISDEIPR